MPVKVLLKDIVEGIEMQSEEVSPYLDLDTGRVRTIFRDLPGKGEESDESRSAS
jgi:hypothetical protein